MRRRLSAALSELLRHLPANDSSRKYAAMLIKLEDSKRSYRFDFVDAPKSGLSDATKRAFFSDDRKGRS
jgi:hypothetical protein